jgi:predicted RNA polymerase sigma factor
MGRVLTSIAPHEPEAHGLLALMELRHSGGSDGWTKVYSRY